MLELLIVWSIILFESIVIGCATEHGLIRLAYGRDFELGGKKRILVKFLRLLCWELLF